MERDQTKSEKKKKKNHFLFLVFSHKKLRFEWVGGDKN
jgi:hypothetical protein